MMCPVTEINIHMVKVNLNGIYFTEDTLQILRSNFIAQF